MKNYEDLNITLTCASGLEKSLKSELIRLGYGEVPITNGATTVSGNGFDVARLNIFLRTCDRVYISLKKFGVSSFDELYEGVKSIPFENFIDKFGKIPVDGKCVKSKLFATSACQSIVKKAIVDRLTQKFGLSTLPETGAEYKIDFYIFKDECEIRLNTSGNGLHKRGYRKKVWIAPIKETLASAIILYSDYYKTRPLLDPFCGSGTFAVESALISKNIAPGIFREFDFNKWKTFDSENYKKALEEAKDKVFNGKIEKIYASDIDKKAIALAKEHAVNAGVYDDIEFSVSDVNELKPKFSVGTIVTNPPYGDRVYGKDDAKNCYKALGKIKTDYPNISQFVITESKNFEKDFGFTADRKRKLYNSNKECNLYYYYGKKEN